MCAAKTAPQDDPDDEDDAGPMPSAARAATLVRPVAAVARRRPRHWLTLASFATIVVLPTLVAAWYLMARAADQYASLVGFTVRTEETSSPIELLGGITSLGSSSSTDSDVLFEFIRSQQMVELVDKRLDLGAIYGRPEDDPFFRYDPAGTIEDLVDYWDQMVSVYYDANTGLIDLRILAFTAEDAKAVASAIFDLSSIKINELSAIAQQDATRYAREELDVAVSRLKTARQALTEFRALNQIIDPAADLQGQMGLLNSLQTQLADALIELDLLNEVTREGDARIDQSRRKITVIEARIADERRKLGSASAGDPAFTSIVGRFEELKVDLEFAETSYLSALAAYDTAAADARRKSRYLAAYVEPTLAQSPRYPRRWTLLALTGLFLFLTWSIGALIAYSVKDRR